MKKTENILEPKSKDKINQEIREMDDIITIIVGGIFLAIWAYANHLYQVLINSLKLSNFDKITALIFQVIFFGSTLICILIGFYKHIRIIWIKANQVINNTIEDSKK